MSVSGDYGKDTGSYVMSAVKNAITAMVETIPEITIKDGENELDARVGNEEYKNIHKDVVEYTTPIINALNELPVYHRCHISIVFQKIPMYGYDGYTLNVGHPVVMQLTTARALRLRSVTVVNERCCAKRMEVCTGPAKTGPWTSVATFTSAQTKERQTFAAAPDAPALGGFVKVLVHDTYVGDKHAYVAEVSLEGEAWGPAESSDEIRWPLPATS